MINIMKKVLLTTIVLTLIIFNTSAQTGNKAFLLIDIRDFYFPGGKSALVEPEKAAANAAKLLERFRKRNMPIIHVRRNSKPNHSENFRQAGVVIL
jgi:nicotinamidase-related amidase